MEAKINQEGESREKRNLRYFYPELDAGGFTRIDGSIAFYLRVNALLRPEMNVLDFGAGRGAQFYDVEAPFRNSLRTIKGKVGRLVGVDVDEAVLENPFLDEAHVIDAQSPLPFADETFDLIYADWVLEHVATPAVFAAEVGRILRPGGWFCARTPNRWGITGIGANLIPNRLHTKFLNRLQPDRQDRDVFPTTYQLNTIRRLRRYFQAGDWDNYSYFYSAEPAYVQGSKLLILIAKMLMRAAPPAMGTDLHVFLRKR